MTTSPEHMPLEALKRQQRMFAVLLMAVLLAIGTTLYFSCFQEKKELRGLIEGLSDTLSRSNAAAFQAYDSLSHLNAEIVMNKIKEDSLQDRIGRSLDSLELLENKLKFMQENSSIALEAIASILDSMEFYRTETGRLKLEIERVNEQTAQLLQRERESNDMLRQRIATYEKRLMSLFAINVEIMAYSDGYDSNSRLVTTSKSQQVKQFEVKFSVSRVMEPEDRLSVTLLRAGKVVLRQEDVTVEGRGAKPLLEITPDMDLRPGRYKIEIHHDNARYDIVDAIVGTGFIDLD